MIREKIREIGDNVDKFEWAELLGISLNDGFILSWECSCGNVIIKRIKADKRTRIYLNKTWTENKIPLSDEEEEFITEIFSKAFDEYIKNSHKERQDKIDKGIKTKEDLLNSISLKEKRDD